MKGNEGKAVKIVVMSYEHEDEGKVRGTNIKNEVY